MRNIVEAKKMYSCKPHFKTLEMLTVYSIYILELAKFVKKKSTFIQTILVHA